MEHQYVSRFVNLVPESRQQLLGMEPQQALDLLASGEPEQARAIPGSFALATRRGEKVLMARSLDRPLRYFLAKEVEGPLLVVAESIAEIAVFLERQGYGDQFHPSYTRMVPAHHVTTVRLVGCPDPAPSYERFVAPARGPFEAGDLDAIGAAYVGALRRQVEAWLEAVPASEPIGVLFSGGVDSGSVFLAVYRSLLARGMSPARLKAFTLSIDGGSDVAQAREFLRRLDLELFLEPVEATPGDLDPLAAVEIIEDYKPLDVQCAAVGLALLARLRRRYPDWRFLIDGDGGDENLKDYPIEENSELTITSVVNNPFLYQEGWGVECLKHSLTHSGGLSRACTRTAAPARHFDFVAFSPYTMPALVELAAAIPFAELAAGDHDRLYALKGEIVGRGVRQVLGFEMPIFEKSRFQRGATSTAAFEQRLAGSDAVYREHFLRVLGPRAA